jgi:ssDNA-binding Zn-finger/Zn-ribbon topoisomerase 1
MHIQDQRLEHKRIVRTQVCKVCHGALVEKRIDGQDVVVCAADPTHQGFISQAQAIAIERKQRLETAEVLSNYPKFKPPTTETAQQSIDLLWG